MIRIEGDGYPVLIGRALLGEAEPLVLTFSAGVCDLGNGITMDDALAAGSRLVRCADEAARLLDVGPRDLGNEEAVLDLAVLLFRAGTADAALAAATSMALTPSVLHALRQRPHSPLARARAA